VAALKLFNKPGYGFTAAAILGFGCKIQKHANVKIRDIAHSGSQFLKYFLPLVDCIASD